MHTLSIEDEALGKELMRSLVEAQPRRLAFLRPWDDDDDDTE